MRKSRLSQSRAQGRRHCKHDALCKGVTYVLLPGFGFTMVIPFLWMVSTSLKDESQVLQSPPWLIPTMTTYYYDPGDGEEEASFIRERVSVRFKEGPGKDTVQEDVSAKRLLALRRWWSPWGKGYAVNVRMDVPRKRWWAPWKGAGPETVSISSLMRVEVLSRTTSIRRKSDRKSMKVPSSQVRKEEQVYFAWRNYPEAWRAVSLSRGYVNSTVVALLVTAGQVFTSSMAAYAFSRLRFPGRDKLFIAYLATMMIPYIVTMIPVFILFTLMPQTLDSIFNTKFWNSDMRIGNVLLGRPVGLDSCFALIVPALFSAYGTFLLQQFFMGIPRNLDDAARIDGSSLVGIYYHVILPLSKPALATLTIFTFMGSWRSFMWPLIVVNKPHIQTLPVMLSSFQSLHTTQWTLLMAASVCVMIPMLLVFIIGQRWFISGIRLGAIKG